MRELTAKQQEMVNKLEAAKGLALDKFSRKEISYADFCKHWDNIDELQRGITGEEKPDFSGGVVIDLSDAEWVAVQ